MTDEEKKLLMEFKFLRVNAENKKELSLNNMVDYHYFATLTAIYQLKRVGRVPEEKISRHLTQLKSNYVTDKGIYLRDSQCSEDDLHRRMTCSELLTELNKNADKMPLSEIFESFAEIIELGFDKISGENVRRKLRSRDEGEAALICQGEAEGYICELLLLLRFTAEEVAQIIIEAKRSGFGIGKGFKIKYEGDKFALYKI